MSKNLLIHGPPCKTSYLTNLPRSHQFLRKDHLHRNQFTEIRVVVNPSFTLCTETEFSGSWSNPGPTKPPTPLDPWRIPALLQISNVNLFRSDVGNGTLLSTCKGYRRTRRHPPNSTRSGLPPTVSGPTSLSFLSGPVYSATLFPSVKDGNPLGVWLSPVINCKSHIKPELHVSVLHPRCPGRGEWSEGKRGSGSTPGGSLERH